MRNKKITMYKDIKIAFMGATMRFYDTIKSKLNPNMTKYLDVNV